MTSTNTQAQALFATFAQAGLTLNPTVEALFSDVSLGTNFDTCANHIFRASSGRMTGGQALIDTFGILVSPEQIKKCNQKAAMRLIEAVHFAIDPSAQYADKVTVTCFLSVIQSAVSRASFETLRFSAGEKVENPIALQGLDQNKLRRFAFLESCKGTVQSKISRTFGDRGFFSAIGVSAKIDGHNIEFNSQARENPIVVAFAMGLEKMTQGQIDLMKEKFKIEV